MYTSSLSVSSKISRQVRRCLAVSSSAGIRKPRIAIVGAGWAGYRIAQDLDKSKFDVEVISPRNHFLFTPLLPSTTVGTLEFRAIQEPVRTIPKVVYHQANVNKIDFENNKLLCSDALDNGFDFELPYDGLVLAPGSETNTLGVPGVTNNPNVFFLKQLSHSRAIRNKLLECFERASSPAVTSDAHRRELLTFVVVGGGPTSIEFASELYDFLEGDVSRWYPDLYPLAKVKIIEASGHILGSFNHSLVGYVEKLFKKRNVAVLTDTVVHKIEGNKAFLSDQSEMTFGMMVWSTGIKQVPLIESLSEDVVAKHARGRLKVDGLLRLLAPPPPPPPHPSTNSIHNNNNNNNSNSNNSNISNTANTSSMVVVAGGNVFGMGDCAADEHKPLPALAQVASQQGMYLAKLLNEHGLQSVSSAPPTTSSQTHQHEQQQQQQQQLPVFQYTHLGSMASVGDWKGVFDSPSLNAGDRQIQTPPVSGFLAFLLWRSAYWTKQVSLVNKILIPMYWFKCMLFGRDISRF